jgi:hypothetical protein
MDVLDIKKKDAENLVVTKMDENILSQNFNDLTFFQIFRHKEAYFTLLEDNIKAKEIVE